MHTLHPKLCAHLAAADELVENLGHAWCIIQEHEALADHNVVRLRAVLIQPDQQLQHLQGVRSMVPHASGAEQGKLFSWQDPLLVSGVSHCIDAKTDTSPPYVSISTQQLLPHVEYIELGPEPHMHVTAIGAS
jgi:hypothetical protein